MIKKQNHHGLTFYLPEKSDYQLDFIYDLLAKKPTEILRQHHRSLVIKIRHNNCFYVIKQPLNKNKSHWARFTTLYRKSEVLRDLISQLLFAKLTIASVTPVAAIERRQYSMVIDGWIIYKYRDGMMVNQTHFDNVIDIMNRLHEAGYIHDDPHLKNFLADEKEVFLIDCKPRRYYFSKASRAYNFIFLLKRCHAEHRDELRKRLPTDLVNSPIYKLMLWRYYLGQIHRKTKNKIRESLKIDYKNK